MITVLRCVLWLVFFSFAARAETVPADSETFAAGSGSFHFPLEQGKRSLEVFTYQPQGANENTPIVIVMTGVNRNAITYRNDWINVADQYHLRIIVPRFTEQDFPGSLGYPLGNMIDAKTHHALPQGQWSYTLVNAIFESLRQKGLTHQTQYYLFGNSAGCQFVHRMLTLLPQPQVKATVCAAAGWWTLPDTDQRWPYGLRQTPVNVNQGQISDYFAKPMLIVVGSDDDDPENHLLRRSKQAMAQGANRLERAENYFTASQQRAEQNNTPFNWHFVVLPGVGHNGAKMSIYAAGQFAWFEQHHSFNL
jgi:poly(3-hydroxybutyrate) depolymerase